MSKAVAVTTALVHQLGVNRLLRPVRLFAKQLPFGLSDESLPRNMQTCR
jgi:hypothetical protein